MFEDKRYQTIVIEGKNMEILLRGKLNNDNRDIVDIVGYDLELGKFDCHDGQTRVPDDFIYFIIPKDEMKEINKYISKLNEAKSKTAKKKVAQELALEEE